jgi:hypothetical protein
MTSWIHVTSPTTGNATMLERLRASTSNDLTPASLLTLALNLYLALLRLEYEKPYAKPDGVSESVEHCSIPMIGLEFRPRGM